MTIPDDVMERAMAVLVGRRLAFDNESGPGALTEAIANALMEERARATEAERERCAGIVDQYPVENTIARGVYFHILEIAAAIRKEPA